MTALSQAVMDTPARATAQKCQPHSAKTGSAIKGGIVRGWTIGPFTVRFTSLLKKGICHILRVFFHQYRQGAAVGRWTPSLDSLMTDYYTRYHIFKGFLSFCGFQVLPKLYVLLLACLPISQRSPLLLHTSESLYVYMDLYRYVYFRSS